MPYKGRDVFNILPKLETPHSIILEECKRIDKFYHHIF
jgi:hypothetical protein